MDTSHSKVSADVLEARWRDLQARMAGERDDPEFLVELGNLALEMGRRSEAWMYLHKALTRDPDRTYLLPQLRKLADSPERKRALEGLGRRPLTFRESLKGIWRYPLEGNALGLLLLGVAMLFLARLMFGTPLDAFGMELIQFSPYLLMGWVFTCMVVLYISAFFVDVLYHSATGSDDMPPWPDVIRGDFWTDAFKVVNAFFVSFLPGWILLAVFMVGGSVGDAGGMPGGRAGLVGVLAAIGVAGSLYLPMAILANVMYGNPLACLNPVFVVRSILKTGRDYLVCLGACVATVLTSIVLEMLVVFGLSGLEAAFGAILVEFYGMALVMRLLGLYYRINRSRMGWMVG